MTTASAAIARKSGKLPPFDAHQVDWINDKSSFKVSSKCRRSGYTWAEAFAATKERATGERVSDYWYSGLDESTAREFMQYVTKFGRDLFGKLLEVHVQDEVVAGTFKTFSVTLPPVKGPTGQVREPRISAMTSSPGNFRSKGGDVCLDEFAKHPDQRELWAAAQGCAMRGGRVRILSTHPSEPNMFDEFVEMGKRRQAGEAKPLDKPVSLHVCDIDRAIAGGLVERVNQTEGTSWTREAYRAHVITMAGDAADSELFCKTGGTTGSYLPYELTRPRVVAGLVGIIHDGDQFLRALVDVAKDSDGVFLGCDVGRKNDRFTVAADSKRGGMDRIGPILSWQNRDFGQMEGLLVRAMRMSLPGRFDRIRRGVGDAAGLGMQLNERLEQLFRTRWEGINTGVASVREDLWTRCRAKLEEATCALPDDVALLSQLASVRKIVTAGKHDRYDVDRNAEGHADEAWAVVNAMYAAGRKTSEARMVPGEML